jgi:hypothetical protein
MELLSGSVREGIGVRCPARAKTCGDELISQLNEHTHGPDPTRKDVTKVTSAITHRATETQETAQQIISTAVSHKKQHNQSSVLLYHTRNSTTNHQYCCITQETAQPIISTAVSHKKQHNQSSVLLYHTRNSTTNHQYCCITQETAQQIIKYGCIAQETAQQIISTAVSNLSVYCISTTIY